MTSILYTPMDLSAPVQSGRRRFWKQLLPVTSIDYKGTKVDFDPEFHKDLQLSFADKAYDQVPLVFADANNAHNMDPRNFGGELLDVKYRGPSKGTWGLIEADEDAAKAIEKNPKLGVSARIIQGLNKADGRSFKRAINHVLLTMNPRVSGMEPWQAVDLSDEDTDIEVVDLTAATYEEGTVMAKRATKTKTTSGDLSSLDLSTVSDEEFQQLLDLAQTALDADEEEDLDDLPDEGEDDVEVPPTVGKKRRHKSKTKITVEKDSEDDDEGDDDDEDEEDETDLSDSDHVIKRGEVSQFQQMRLDLAEERWGRERDRYVDAGVPPFLLDLAEPVLSQPDSMTIDLAGDETLDATDTIRKMLDGVKGIVDLSGEIGHAVDLSDRIEANDAADQFLASWDEQYG